MATMNKGGRPELYKPEYCDMLIDHMSKGMSYESFAANLRVARDTLYEWEKRHKEFFDSKMIGKELMLSYFEKMGINAMTGKIKGFNAATYIFTMKNKCNWREKSETELSTSDDGLRLCYTLKNEK